MVTAMIEAPARIEFSIMSSMCRDSSRKAAPPAVLRPQGQPQLALPLSDPRLSRPYSGTYWQIDLLGSANGASAAPVSGQLRSRSLWDHVLVVPADTPADGQLHQHRVRGPQDKMLGMIERSVRIEDLTNGSARTLRLIAAADERFMEAPVASLNGTLWLALGVLAAGLVMAALVQVLVGLAPLRSLRSALGKVHSGETQQLEGSFPGEIMPLINEFNTVLERNAEVVERARTHAGNLAHALKTPLSVLANAAGAAIAAPGKEAQATELARLVAEQVSIARKQVDYHLARAQAAATSRVPGAKTALQPVLDGLLRVMRRVHAERQLDIVLAPFDPALSFRGEAQDLQEMLGNLLDNACKWATQHVELSARTEASSLTIVIDDDGLFRKPPRDAGGQRCRRQRTGRRRPARRSGLRIRRQRRRRIERLGIIRIGPWQSAF